MVMTTLSPSVTELALVVTEPPPFPYTLTEYVDFVLPVLTTMFTDSPSLSFSPAAGLWLMTRPDSTVSLGAKSTFT